MEYVIYKATSPSGKVYVGMTTQSFYARKAQHKYMSRIKQNIFHRAIYKYGFDNFNWDILFSTDNLEELGRKETEFITQLKSNNRNFGYNEKVGGQSGWQYSPEVRRKMSLSQQKRSRNRGNRHNCKRIKAFKDAQLIGQWDSIAECSKELHIDRTTISKCLNGVRVHCRAITFEVIM